MTVRLTYIGYLCKYGGMPEPARDLNSELVTQAARLMRAVRRNLEQPSDAGPRLLGLIDEVGPSTVGTLASTDHSSQPSMTGLINGLVSKGWLERTPNPLDARSSLVSLTAVGREALAEIRRRNADLVARRAAAAGITHEELATTVAVLSRLLSHDLD